MILTQNKLKNDDIVLNSRKYSQLNKANYSDPDVYCDEILNKNLISCDIKRSHTNPWEYEIRTMLQKAGKHYFYVVVNEGILKGSPIELTIEESEQDELLKKKEEEERKVNKIFYGYFFLLKILPEF